MTGWRLQVAAVTLSAAAGVGVTVPLFTSGAATSLALAVPLPAVWLGVAVACNRTAGTRLSAWTGLAVVYTLAAYAVMLLAAVETFGRVRLPGVRLGHPGAWEGFLLAAFPLALVVLAVATVARWRRTPDPDG